MTKAGVKGAILNVRINLGSIKDEAFVGKISKELSELENSTERKTEEILKIVEKAM